LLAAIAELDPARLRAARDRSATGVQRTV